MPVNEKYVLVRCPICHATMRQTALAKHMRRVHAEDDPSKDKRMVKCETCGVSVRRDRLAKHIEQAHTEKPSKKPKHVTCRYCGVTMSRGEWARHDCEESPFKKLDQPPPVVLISRRGKRIEGGGCCSECHAWVHMVWRYTKSNRGVVDLCAYCKAIVFDRSFGACDALNSAVTSQFESNPRKH